MEPDEPICFIEVPAPAGASPPPDDPGPDNINDFQGALDRLINTFMCPKIRSVDEWQHPFFSEVYYQRERMKLLVYSRESLDTVEGWVREFVVASAKPPSSISSPTTSLTSSTSQTQYEEAPDSSKVSLESGEDMQPTQKDDADV
jgi:hypothetical protein